MTIWLFGDSFAQMNNKNVSDPDSWPELLSDSLTHDLKILGHNGTGLEHMFYIFNENVDQINNNDIVVICMTSFVRNWFLTDRPIVTHSYRVNVIKSNPDQFSWLRLTDEEIKAIELYELHLNNQTKLEVSSEFLFRILNSMAKEKAVSVVIMNFEENITEQWRKKYDNLRYVDGYLAQASYAEYNDPTHAQMNNDMRAGHFSYNNHKIIADKLKNLILHKDPFNLNSDLEQKFI